MGIDLSKIAADLIKKVEIAVNGENSVHNNAKLEDHEVSIFNSELAKLKQEQNLSDSDVTAIMGFVRSDNGPAKATSKNNPDIYIQHDINVSIDINITVNVDADDLKAALAEAWEKFLEEYNDKLASDNEKYLAFIKAVYEQFDIQNGNMNDLIKVLNEMLAEVKNIDEVVNQLLVNSFRTIGILGVNSQVLLEIAEKEDNQTQLLADIYQAINAITDCFNDEKYVDKINEAIALLESNGATLTDILGMLTLIQKDTSKNKELSEKILKATKENGKLIESGFDKLLQAVNRNTVLSEKILAAVENLGDDVLEKLALIFDQFAKIEGGGDTTVVVDFKPLEDLLAQLLGEVQAGREENKDGINALLGAMGENTEVMQQILEAVNKFGPEILASLAKIYENQEAGEVSDAEVKELLNLVLKQLEENSEENKAGFEALLKAVGENTEVAKQILEFVKQFGEDVAGDLAQIYKRLGDLQIGSGGGDTTVVVDFSKLEEMMAEMLELMEESNKQNKAGFKALLEAMGNNTAMIEKVLDAIETYGPQIVDTIAKNTAAINVLTEQVKVNGAENKEGLKAVLDKLENLPLPIDVSNLEALLQDIKALTGENGEKLGNIIANQEVIISCLETFAQGVQAAFDKVEEKLAEIYDVNSDEYVLLQEQHDELLKKLDGIADLIGRLQNGECNCDVDGVALMDKLQQILEAIQNQDLKCECNCGNGEGDNSNEDIVDDLDNIFGANARRETSNATITYNETNVTVKRVLTSGNEYNLPEGTYIFNEEKGVIYNTAGDVVFRK